MRQCHCQQDGDRADHQRRQPEHRVPAGCAGDQGGDRARQQDTEQQPAHHLADDFAAARFGGEMGGDQQDDLGHAGAEAEDQCSRQEDPDRRRQHGRDEARDDSAQRDENELLVLDDVAKRAQQQKACHIAGLDGGDDEAGMGDIDAERLADRPDQGLGVIEVGDRRAGPGSEAKDQPCRQGAVASGEVVHGQIWSCCWGRAGCARGFLSNNLEAFGYKVNARNMCDLSA